MSITRDFDPARDGWYFANWGEAPPYCIGSCDFTWDLYRQTYMGVNPTHDCIEAPLDCAFYEIFKNCAEQGNCGGMSLLALAIFKYGGYMGFCGPASFYTGVTSPDRNDLHQMINIMQARQFSAPGIENFLDVVNAGNLSNAEAAFNKIRSHLGNGDYAILSIANDLIGEAAHTTIPYEIDETPVGEPAGTKVVYVWDPNFPFDTNEDYYAQRRNRVVIRSPFEWEYHQGFYSGAEHGGTHYSSSIGSPGWCFAIPMSVVLRKARQPIAVDMVIEGLTALFVSGSGAAVAQIEDESGRRFYKTDADGHMRRNEVETDPNRRLYDVARWPWYAQTESGALPGELYFMRRPVGSPDLQFTLHGRNYKLMYTQTSNLVEIEARGQRRERARDVLRMSKFATDHQAITIETDGASRGYDIQQLRLFSKGGGWRSIDLQNARLNANRLHFQTIGDLHAFEISGWERPVNFTARLRQYTGRDLITRSVGRHAASAGRTVRFVPQDWANLGDTEVDKQFLQGKG